MSGAFGEAAIRFAGATGRPVAPPAKSLSREGLNQFALLVRRCALLQSAALPQWSLGELQPGAAGINLIGGHALDYIAAALAAAALVAAELAAHRIAAARPHAVVPFVSVEEGKT